MIRLLPLLLLGLLACGERTDPNLDTRENSMDAEAITEEATPANMPPEFIEVLDAHGTLATWNAHEAVSFQLDGFPSGETGRTLTDNHRVNLRSRDQIIRGDGYVVVSREDTTWATPDLNVTGVPPRMYQAATFYLFGMPFVFADPGITVAYRGQTDFDREAMLEFEVQFPEDMGDGGNSYRLFADPQTKQLQYGTWTVMYPAVADQNLKQMVHFQEWQTVDGLAVPRTVMLYTASGEITPDTPGSTFTVDQVEFSDVPYAEETFDRPEGGVVDKSYVSK